MKEASPKTIHLSDYQAPAYWVKHADLVFDLREQGTRVKATLQVERHADQPADTPLRFDGEGLKSIALAIDGQPLATSDYEIDETGIRIASVPASFVLSSEVEIAPESNTALEGLYRSSSMFCTQCEAEGFRKITWFPDRPDVMATFDVRVEADQQAYPVLLSNGNPGETGELEGGRHFAQWHDPIPKPCYLFALVAGDLRYIQDKHTTPSGRSVDLRIYVEPENIDKCQHAMDSLINAMRWDEQQYGREYDLDIYNIVAVNDFNMGAMENKGLNVFNSKFVLARRDTATDVDFLGVEGVIAHEYFHNWTGNRITCRDWFQLSLKEGLTVFRDQEFSADMNSRGVKRIEDVRLLRAHQFAEDSGPMAHPVRPASYIEINNFYTVTVYEKGAEVVRMQANLLGPELYRKATDLYFERHDGQAVTTEDFVACMEQVSGRDLSQFKHWYDYAGTPKVEISDSYDAASRCYRLHMRQSVPDTPGQTDKPAFHIPIAVGLLDAQGNDLALEGQGTVWLELTEREQSFEFCDVAERPVPSLLRGFSAPVRVEYDYSDAQLQHLMSYDSDGFNRWEAGQILLRRELLALCAQHAAGEPMAVNAALIDTLRLLVLDRETDAALLAEVLTLPDLNYLGDFLEVVDVDGLHAAREWLRASVASGLRDELIALYQRLASPDGYRLEPAAMGERSLRNRALWYLWALADDAEVGELVVAQYQAQQNMTDVIAALALLANSQHASRDAMLADFAERWQHEPLVMDKWFSVQAQADLPETLAQIETLMAHPAFSMSNPNKVRSLIGAFANANPVQFHAADGRGYRFVASQVLALDRTNPQIAARLLRSLSRWQRYDAGRAEHMRAALQRIVESKVSKDVYEIASKSLG